MSLNPYQSSPESPRGPMLTETGARKPFPGFWGAVLLCLIFVAVQIVGGAIIGVVIMATVRDPEAVGLLMVPFLGLINIGAFALTMWAGLSMGGLRWKDAVRLTAFRDGLVPAIVVAVIGMGILGSEVDNFVRYLLPVPDFLAQLVSGAVSRDISTMILILVIAPVTEELLFRGLILQGLWQRYGAVAAIAISTLLFALIHLNPYQMSAAIAIGIFTGWLFVRTRSLWPCILAHSLYNSQVIVIPLLSERLELDIPGYTGAPADVPVGQFAHQPLLFDLLGLVLLVVAVWVSAYVTRVRMTEDAGKGRELKW